MCLVACIGGLGALKPATSSNRTKPTDAGEDFFFGLAAAHSKKTDFSGFQFCLFSNCLGPTVVVI